MRSFKIGLLSIALLLAQFTKGDKLDSLLQVIKTPMEDTNRVKDLCTIATLFRSYGILDTSIIFAGKSLAMAKKLNSNSYVIDALTEMGISYATMGNFAKAEETFKEALKISQQKGTQKDIGDQMMNIGNVKRISGKDAEAIEDYKRSIELLEPLKDTGSIASAYLNLGLSYYNLGDYWRALDYYKIVIKSVDGTRFRSLHVNTLNNIAGAYLLMGKVNEAEKYYYQVLAIQEKANKPAGLAQICSNIGVLYQKQNKLEEARKMFDRSLENYQKVNNVDGMAGVYNNIGAIYQIQKKYSEALKYMFRSIDLKKQLNDLGGIALSESNVASIYDEQGKYEEATKLYLDAIKLNKQVGDVLSLGISYCNIGSSYRKQKQFAESEKYLKMSLEICEKIHDLEGLRDGEKAINALYADMGQVARAYDHYKKYVLYKDSMINKDNIEKSVEAKMQYEFSKKETEAKLEQEKKDALLEDEKRVQAVIRNSFIAGFCLVLILAVVILRGYRNKKKANELITQQKKEVELQKHIVEEKNREILDSINYAKRIQQSLLANEEVLNEYLPNHFVFFKPKDIVSGDFYWAAKEGDKFFLAICDSTGHGVPGAFMSLLNIGFLAEAIKEKGITSPDKIFNYTRERLVESISKDGQRDGFDGILVCFDLKQKKITYAAANNAPMLLTNGKLTQLSTDKMPVGLGEKKQDFSIFTIDHTPGSVVYFYTDGYADQFGGPKGKKFMYKKLNDLLFTNTDRSLQDQKQILTDTFETWRGKLEQVDDVCVIGIKL
jgi:tetratricopeptide (TPR) repeat protein